MLEAGVRIPETHPECDVPPEIADAVARPFRFEAKPVLDLAECDPALAPDIEWQFRQAIGEFGRDIQAQRETVTMYWLFLFQDLTRTAARADPGFDVSEFLQRHAREIDADDGGEH
jgi:hypothetical protein